MPNSKLFNTLEISGSFLVPGFSIYVLEIIRDKEKWFYIGMTGDPHYPSARAAFHRLSGHLELANRSTQNQLRIALKEKLGVESDADLKKLTIKMHHYPIDGFERITDKILDNETAKELKQTEEYKKYKVIQRKVLSLENALIYDLQERLLNKSSGKKISADEIPFRNIYYSIMELVSK